MIKLTNVRKIYQNRVALSRINFEFPRTGLYIIYGESGSGKTTLLNCLSGLIPFEGSIEIDHQNIETLSDNELSNLRLNSYGFVFQDFKLFENETALANLLFPLETLNNLSNNIKYRKCLDLLSIVGLEKKEKQIVNKLSGGEKQRVAIARALINDPKVLLADEPTGALDEKNGEEIMNILKTISHSSLVIVVSHDRELTRKYADSIIEMDNGKIIKVVSDKNKKEGEKHLPVVKNALSNKKMRIPSNFLLSHTYHNMKQKKFRTFICYSMTSLGLIGVGLAFTLSSTISGNIKDAYKEIVSENSMMVSLKKNNSLGNGQFAANYYEVQEIKEKYHQYIDDVGVTYYANFEKFFPDLNNLVIAENHMYTVVPGFSARHINDFTWLEDATSEIYPETIDSLEDDEVVLGLTYDTLIDLCFNLQIERSVRSLSTYLKTNELKLYFDFANNDWTYDDQQIVRMVGFTLESDLKIYHSNHLWNEYMYETRMCFPTSDALSIVDNYPWVMKKIYYLKTKQNRDELLNLLYEDKVADEYLFEIANETYYPWLYYEKEMSTRNRLLVFVNTTNHFPLWQIPYFINNDPNLKEPIIANNAGYSIYPETLMMGFAKTMYFSRYEDDLNSIIDHQTTNNVSGFVQEELPSTVLSGDYANSLQNGVNFSIQTPSTFLGRPAEKVDEIVLSTALFNKLGFAEIGEDLYVATSKNEMLVNGNQIIKDYALVRLTVVGLINSNKMMIYQNKNWTTLFYQCLVGVSAYKLQCQSLSFPLNNPDKIDHSIELAKTAFPQYEIFNPLSDVNSSVDSVCFYITIVLIIFSSVAVIISILLLTICNYLFIIESRKEIALARCIGVNKKESKKFLLWHSFIQCLASFAVASLELFGVSLIANFEVTKTLSLGFSFSFNPIALVPMLVLSLVIALFSSMFMSGRINKINPIEALKA
ncbi:MAG: ATP-binding cassette domain-containing protein [Bacilli bacterium]|nr:ATP-binding cassette domain-containing protein [Bacilli bacterium]